MRFRRQHPSTDPKRGERGQALALFAGGLIALLVATGMVLDGGLVFVARRDAQNSADLGALAGTRIVAEFHKGESVNGASVFAAIDKAVEENGCTVAGDGCDWTAHYVRPTSGYQTTLVSSVANGGDIPDTAQGVEVHVDRDPGTNFLRVVGLDDWDVGAEATAITARIEDPGQGILLPIAFDPGRHPLEVNAPYLFSEEKDGPGNFSWLSWNDDNSANYNKDIVCEPLNPAYDLPEYIPGGPGKMNSNEMRECLQDYVGTVVYVPLWEDPCDLGPGFLGPPDVPASKSRYCIYGVGAFLFHGFDGNPAIDNVYGSFQEYVTFTSVPANFGGPPCDQATDPTCMSPTSYLGLIK